MGRGQTVLMNYVPPHGIGTAVGDDGRPSKARLELERLVGRGYAGEASAGGGSDGN